MTLIEKIERALAFARELGMNDVQTKELMLMILEQPYFRITTPPNQTPLPGTIPWIPGTPMWGPNSGDYGCPGVLPPNTTLCACSPDGVNHSDSCKAA